MNLNYCGVCGDFLGPDDFDGICAECNDAICDDCGENMVTDGVDDIGCVKYRCPFCAPATDGEKRLNAAIVQADDEIGNLSVKLSELIAQLEAVMAERDELSSLLAANVVIRAAQKLELDGVTAERDALMAQFEAVPVMAIKFYVNNTEPDYDMMAYWEDNRPVFEKAKIAIVDWLRGQV